MPVLCLFYAFFRGVAENRLPFFYLPTKILDFLHVHAQMIPWDPCFGIFQKYAYLHPWRISGSSVFFENCNFFTLYFCVFLFIDQNLSPFAWACSNDPSRALFFHFSKRCIFASVTEIRVLRIFWKRSFLLHHAYQCMPIQPGLPVHKTHTARKPRCVLATRMHPPLTRLNVY